MLRGKVVPISHVLNSNNTQNYQWWWQSFFVGGGSALWVFLACTWYYFFKLHITGFVSSMLFFAYSFLACLVYGLLTGTIGFLAAYAFVRRIYGYDELIRSNTPTPANYFTEQSYQGGLSDLASASD